MAIKGKQIGTGADGIATANIVDAAVTKAKTSSAILAADGSRPLTAHWDVGSFKITNLAAPSSANDAARLSDVTAAANGLDVKLSVRLATAAALAANTAAGSGVGKTLTADANGALSVDGVAVAVADRILVKNEATGANNGIYVVTATGSGAAPFVLTRATDADQDAEVTNGLFAFVSAGSANASSGWVLTTADPITVDTSALSFTQISGTAGITGSGVANRITYWSGTSAIASDADFTWDPTGNVLTVGGSASFSGLLSADGHIDRSSSAALNIGGTNATTLSLGRSGQTQALLGNATVAGTLVVSGLLSADAHIDRSSAAALNIGGTNATTLSLGRSGQTQALLGAATVASSLDVGSHLQLAEIAAPSTPASGFGRIYVKTDNLLYFKNDAGTEYDLTTGISYGSPVAVATANADGVATTVARSDHAHDTIVAATGNKNMTASVTTSDNDQATVTTVAANNGLSGYMAVLVNGIAYSVGSGTKTGVAAYFSGDSGSTARAFSAVVSGDTLHWNGSVAGFQLDATDKIDIQYSAF